MKKLLVASAILSLLSTQVLAQSTTTPATSTTGATGTTATGTATGTTAAGTGAAAGAGAASTGGLLGIYPDRPTKLAVPAEMDPNNPAYKGPGATNTDPNNGALH
jgi:hypothetical protein